MGEDQAHTSIDEPQDDTHNYAYDIRNPIHKLGRAPDGRLDKLNYTAEGTRP